MTVALVDDEKNVRLAVRTALVKEGFDVLEFADGQQAFDYAVAAKLEKPKAIDIFVLDIMMPVMDGITLLRRLRESGIKTPVIFLTSRDEEFDKILGLELGADDYLCKPFSIKELVARIHVILRRCNAADSAGQAKVSKILKSGGIELDLLSYTAKIFGKSADFTVTEFRILQSFIEHKNEVLSREQLIEIAYPQDTYLNDRAVDCHIKRLRKKIPENCIETVYGLGYKYSEKTL